MKLISNFNKIILIAIIALVAASCNGFAPLKGNGTIVKSDKEVKDFSKVSFEGAFNVFISQGEQTKLAIETDENLQEYIVAKVKSNKLTIKNKRNLSASKGINIYLTVAKIEEIDAAGAVIIKSDSKINADKLAIDLSGACNLTLDVNCVELHADMEGYTTMKLVGAASVADISASGSAEIYNFDMLFDYMKLKTKGSVKAKVNVITQLDVSVTGAGDVEYLGTPEVKKEISGSGTVNKIF